MRGFEGTAQTAKLVKETLAKAFPKTKFSVRSKTYSGGSSITASWTDGPTVEQVHPILEAFEGADFDGMTDLKTYQEPVMFRGEVFSPGADYVFPSRHESVETIRKAALLTAFECNLPLLETDERGNIIGDKSEGQVPYHYCKEYSTPDRPVFSHDHHGGEWYPQLVYQVARNMSFEESRPVDLPVRINKHNVDEVASSVVAQGY